MRLTVVERRRQIGEMAGEGGRTFVRVREMVQGLDHGFLPHGYLRFSASVGQWFFVVSELASSPAGWLPHLECVHLWELAC